MKNINKSARNIKNVKLIKEEGTNMTYLNIECNNDFFVGKKLKRVQMKKLIM